MSLLRFRADAITKRVVRKERSAFSFPATRFIIAALTVFVSDGARGDAFPDECGEFLYLESGAGRKETVDVRLGQERSAVLRVYAAAIEKRDLITDVAEKLDQAFADLVVNLLRVFRSSRSSGSSDGPDGFVSDPEAVGSLLRRNTVKTAEA